MRYQSQIITDSHELNRLLSTPGIEVIDLLLASDDVVYISWDTVTRNSSTLSVHQRGDWRLRDSWCPFTALLLPGNVAK